MKRIALGILTVSSLLLVGCSDSPKDPEIPVNVVTKAVYDPANKRFPLPNDLAFSGTTDLTLNTATDDSTADFSDPSVALSGLDGWSAVAPSAISFYNANDPTAALDSSTFYPGGSTVRVFEVAADTTYAGTAPTFLTQSVIRELVPGQEYVATPSGDMTIAIVPLKPLTSRSSYVVIVTNGVLDSNGTAVAADGTYQAGKLSDGTPSLAPIRAIVGAIENSVVAYTQENESVLNVSRDEIIVSYQFTVQSIGSVMASAKALYVDYPYATGGLSTSVSSLMIGTDNLGLAGAADLYKGQVNLSYLLGAPTEDNLSAPLDTFWKAATYVPDGQGGMVANPLAGGHLTYLNSLPEKNGVEWAPLMISVPKSSVCEKPAEGYPVMIFQHGITSNRTAMLGIADTMASLCTVVVSMDLPLHGITETNSLHLALQEATGGMIGLFENYAAGGVRERTFGVDLQNNTTTAPGPDSLIDSSGAHFINLQNLLVSRDNLRQAVVDLLTLEKALPTMDLDGDEMPDIDATKISFMGHSLGGIVGSNFVAYSDFVQQAVLANPGGGIAGLLDASDTFGPVVRGGIAAAQGLDPESAEFAAVYQQFLFAAQTVIDSGDPINTTTIALANNVPTWMIRVVDDTVVPNNSATAPLSGTDPLAAYLGLATVVAENPGDTMVGDRLISRFNSGTHSTALTPHLESGDYMFLSQYTEMQRELGAFIGSGGAAVVVTDPTLLD